MTLLMTTDISTILNINVEKQYNISLKQAKLNGFFQKQMRIIIFNASSSQNNQTSKLAIYVYKDTEC